LKGKNIRNLKKEKNKNMRNLLIMLFLFISVRATAPDRKVFVISVPEAIDPYEKLILAIVQVESSGDTMAYNLTEEACGAFQIRPIRLQDYNQRAGKNYLHEDCYQYNISKTIFLYYAKIIGYTDYESIAKSWNGSGTRTIEYWNKVKVLL
jgi:hypothetical protein